LEQIGTTDELLVIVVYKQGFVDTLSQRRLITGCTIAVAAIKRGQTVYVVLLRASVLRLDQAERLRQEIKAIDSTNVYLARTLVYDHVVELSEVCYVRELLQDVGGACGRRCTGTQRGTRRTAYTRPCKVVSVQGQAA